jgi:hypothetical protein
MIHRTQVVDAFEEDVVLWIIKLWMMIVIYLQQQGWRLEQNRL